MTSSTSASSRNHGPIRGQYPGHVIILDQSEASSHDQRPHPRDIIIISAQILSATLNLIILTFFESENKTAIRFYLFCIRSVDERPVGLRCTHPCLRGILILNIPIGNQTRSRYAGLSDSRLPTGTKRKAR